jgi:hypothetical protein
MIDLSAIRQGTESIVKLSDNLGAAELRRYTDEMIDSMHDLIAGCTDSDVVFTPDDPDAYDSAAATAEEVYISWTLGHVIVHVTASSEEAAFQAAELARGVRYRHLRSRYEAPWETVVTIEQCLHRLGESRRMRHASLEMWPDKPFLENRYVLKSGASASVTKDRTEVNAVAKFILGLMHDDSHLGQIAEIVRQAREARQEE